MVDDRHFMLGARQQDVQVVVRLDQRRVGHRGAEDERPLAQRLAPARDDAGRVQDVQQAAAVVRVDQDRLGRARHGAEEGELGLQLGRHVVHLAGAGDPVDVGQRIEQPGGPAQVAPQERAHPRLISVLDVQVVHQRAEGDAALGQRQHRLAQPVEKRDRPHGAQRPLHRFRRDVDPLALHPRAGSGQQIARFGQGHDAARVRQHLQAGRVDAFELVLGEDAQPLLALRRSAGTFHRTALRLQLVRLDLLGDVLALVRSNCCPSPDRPRPG